MVPKDKKSKEGVLSGSAFLLSSEGGRGPTWITTGKIYRHRVSLAAIASVRTSLSQKRRGLHGKLGVWGGLIYTSLSLPQRGRELL